MERLILPVKLTEGRLVPKGADSRRRRLTTKKPSQQLDHTLVEKRLALTQTLEENHTSSPSALIPVASPVSCLAQFIAIPDTPAWALAPGRSREVAIPTHRQVFHADAPEQAAGDGAEVRPLELQKLRGYQYRSLRYERPSKPYGSGKLDRAGSRPKSGSRWPRERAQSFEKPGSRR